jgi:hypothetical protein
VVQVLVQWSGCLEEMTTWEDLDSLRQQFPHASAWVKQIFKRRGLSTPRSHPPVDQSTRRHRARHKTKHRGPRERLDYRPGLQAMSWAESNPCNSFSFLSLSRCCVPAVFLGQAQIEQDGGCRRTRTRSRVECGERIPL